MCDVPKKAVFWTPWMMISLWILLVNLPSFFTCPKAPIGIVSVSIPNILGPSFPGLCTLFLLPLPRCSIQMVWPCQLSCTSSLLSSWWLCLACWLVGLNFLVCLDLHVSLDGYFSALCVYARWMTITFVWCFVIYFLPIFHCRYGLLCQWM